MLQVRVKVQSQRTLTLQAQVKGVVFLRVPFYTTDSVLCTVHITALQLFPTEVLSSVRTTLRKCLDSWESTERCQLPSILRLMVKLKG